MSVYQFLYMDSIANPIVVNESVKLATKRGFGQLKGFVNGVLRNISRNLENIKYPDASDDLVEHLSIMNSVPEWIVEQWIYQYGAEEASKMIKSLGKREHSITVRCNTLKASVEEIMDMLCEEGVSAIKSPYCDTGLYISDFDYITKLKTFNEGYISVQDISSMLVALTAAPKKGQLCLDICAAPGGKSMHLSELMEDDGLVIARDLTDYKVSLIQENIDRVGLKSIRAMKSDALEYEESLYNKVDVVIADLPCSGLGVIGKKSDIKYNMTEEKQNTLVNIQRDILNNAVRYVKRGGYLVYSTCTTNKAENIDNYNWLLQNYDVESVDISEYIPEKLRKKTVKDGYIQLLQGVDDTDGFFIGKVKVK